MPRFYHEDSLEELATEATTRYDVDPPITARELADTHKLLTAGNNIDRLVSDIRDNPGASEQDVAGRILSTSPENVRLVFIGLVILEYMGHIIGVDE